MSVALALRVRHFRDGDEAFVARLAQASFWEFAEAAKSSTLQMANRHPTLIACEGKTPLGFVIVDVATSAGDPTIVALAVEPSKRGRGVGYELLCSAERCARLANAKFLVAHTADFNLPALELFMRNGYRIVRRLPRYYRGRFDACELEKKL
jgi:ribosomal protein S18 acetylase RimI-like enzyme